MPNHLIVNQFKKAFCESKIQSLRGIGIECEIPVVTEDGKAAPLSIIQAMFIYLANKGFNVEIDEYSNLMVAAKRINSQSVKKFEYHTDTITTDTGFSTIEIVLAPQNNLHIIQKSLSDLLNILIGFFDEKKCLMLGYGIQPLTAPSQELLMPKERYCFFEKLSSNHVLKNPGKSDSSFLNITASNQCHIEIGLKDTIVATNVLNALSGLQIALHANSPIWQGQVDLSYKSNREMLWDVSFPNRLNQIGIPPRFRDIESYVDYLFQFKPTLVKRNNRYIQILNKNSFKDFLLNESPTIGSTIDGEQIAIEPNIDDIQQLIPFSWFNARLVPKYGTIESRMCCQQPPKETLTTAALTLGIIENLQAASDLMCLYPLDAWKKIRKQAAQHAFDTYINGFSILPLLKKLLDIATEGLQKRNLQEEIFLQPLYDRLNQKKSPADLAIEAFKIKGMRGLLEHASFKKSTCNKPSYSKSSKPSKTSDHNIAIA